MAGLDLVCFSAFTLAILTPEVREELYVVPFELILQTCPPAFRGSISPMPDPADDAHQGALSEG